MRGKKGQFFILAAVIIVVAVVGLSVIYNTVSVGNSPKKFYSYSQQLNEESGAVVDYSLYTSDNKVSDFINQSVGAVIEAYPGLDVFTCYTNESNSNYLICDNYGQEDIIIYTSLSPIVIKKGSVSVNLDLGGAGTQNSVYNPSRSSIYVGSEDHLTAQLSKVNYTINLAMASSNKYYFIFRANTTAGDILASQS